MNAKMMDSMRANFNNQDVPNVGIFWFSPKSQELFGIAKIPTCDRQFDFRGLKTISTLHKDFWTKQYHKDKALGRPTAFHGDYTQTPRGRVWEQKDVGFIVTVGEWFKDYPIAKKLIQIEFDLPESTEYRIDDHWNIGSGWSGDAIGSTQ